MKTAICVNYKPTDTLSASGFMADLPHGCGLVSNGVYIGMTTKFVAVVLPVLPTNDFDNTFSPLPFVSMTTATIPIATNNPAAIIILSFLLSATHEPLSFSFIFDRFYAIFPV